MSAAAVAVPVERDASAIESVRYPGERRAFWLCVIAAPATIGIVSLVLPSVSLGEFVLLIAAGLLFVSVSRGRLIGSSIRVEARQFPELAGRVEVLAARLGIATPHVFLRDDQLVPIAAVGVGEPYALVISSQYFEMLSHGELDFLIARELGHIAAGHTRFASLLSVSGRENPVVALVFGAWLRRTELTADRIGVACCDEASQAFGAICVTTFHAVGRRVDRTVLAEQRAEIATDPALRLGELIAGVPYATTRLDALRAFLHGPQAGAARAALRARERLAPAPPIVDDRAPIRLRAVAAMIDIAVLAAIVHVPVEIGEKALRDPDARDVTAFARWVLEHATVVHLGASTVLVLAAFLLYSAVLVGLVGQTLGMTVFDLRVVTTSFRRPTIVQTLWRYTVAGGLLCSVVGVFWLWSRIFLHDLLSRTRVVRARRVPIAA